jgi:transposase
VANPRKLSLISRSLRKSDRNDAETLARVARMDPKLLSPIRHRGAQAQRDLSTLTSRDALVSARTQLVNHVRSTVKAVGSRLPSTSAEAFPSKVREAIPTELRAGLDMILDVITTLNEKIRLFDRAVEEACETSYPETKLLRQVPGVGPLTSLAFVLTIEDPSRFQKSRSVGSYVGLTPRTYESGQKDPELRITKAGDATLRRLLVGAAHYVLGPFGPDTDLRRFGLSLAARGRKNAKKRAVVAVARKLAVLLHHLWRTGEVYEPLRNGRSRGPQRTGGEPVAVSDQPTAPAGSIPSPLTG